MRARKQHDNSEPFEMGSFSVVIQLTQDIEAISRGSSAVGRFGHGFLDESKLSVTFRGLGRFRRLYRHDFG